MGAGALPVGTGARVPLSRIDCSESLIDQRTKWLLLYFVTTVGPRLRTLPKPGFPAPFRKPMRGVWSPYWG